MAKRKRATKYNYNKMAEEIREYCERCSEQNLPFFASICREKGWQYYYLWRVAKEGTHEEFSRAVEYLHTVREDFILQGMISGDINPTVGIFLLKATCNYSDKPDTQSLKLELQTDDAITKAIKETFLQVAKGK